MIYVASWTSVIYSTCLHIITTAIFTINNNTTTSSSSPTTNDKPNCQIYKNLSLVVLSGGCLPNVQRTSVFIVVCIEKERQTQA